MGTNGIGLRQSARALAALIIIIAALLYARAASDAAAQGVPDPSAAASCAGGAAIPNPEANPALVRDCETLLEALPALLDRVRLNWSANAPISDWEGVAVGGSPTRVTGLKVEYAEPPKRETVRSDGVVVVEVVRTVEVEYARRAREPVQPPPLLSTLARLDGLLALELIWIGFASEIPPEIGGLRNLRTLNLHRNRMVGGIPPELGRLQNLETLNLSDNRLDGAIPPELGNLRNLATLDLRFTRLGGAIPPEIGGLSKLKALRLGFTGVGGDLSRLANLSQLEELDLFQTGFGGPIPPEMGALSNLRVLDIWNTGIEGPFPDEFRNLTNLRTLKYNFNEFQWGISENPELPAWLTDLTRLETLHVESARGDISEIIKNLKNLREFSCRFCHFTGEIPPEIGELSELRIFALEESYISGPIPPEIGNLSKLEVIEILSYGSTGGYGPPDWMPPDPPRPKDYARYLSGELPKELGKLKNLRVLRVRWSLFEGALPRQLGNLSQLEVLALSANYLEGEIPAELGRLRNLRWLQLHPSKLSGCVPASLERNLRINDTAVCAPPADMSAPQPATPAPAFYAALALVGAVFATGSLAMFAPRRRAQV